MPRILQYAVHPSFQWQFTECCSSGATSPGMLHCISALHETLFKGLPINVRKSQVSAVIIASTTDDPVNASTDHFALCSSQVLADQSVQQSLAPVPLWLLFLKQLLFLFPLELHATIFPDSQTDFLSSPVNQT